MTNGQLVRLSRIEQSWSGRLVCLFIDASCMDLGARIHPDSVGIVVELAHNQTTCAVRVLFPEGIGWISLDCLEEV